MNKKAIELSINFIVMFILAIVMFGVGITFVTDIFLKGEELRESIDAQTENQIMRVLDPNTPVSMPINKLSLHRGEQEVIGIGVLNLRGSDTQEEFSFDVYCDGATDLSGTPICDDDSNPKCIECDIWAFPPNSMWLKNNEKDVGSISIIIPKDAVSGIYIYNVEVEVNGQEAYQTIKKLTVEVLE
jgi:hypothetical protein